MSASRRPLGATGMQITPVGLGTWAIGGPWAYGWGPQHDSDSIATIRAALHAGVNWIDTAANYGLGHAEELVGRAIADLPETDRPLVFTKCGMSWDPDDPRREARKDLRPEALRRQCEDSLRRLRVERLDLLQVHWPDRVGPPIEESWGTMCELVAEGKVRAAGVSNFDLDLLRRCQAVGQVATLQPPLSLIARAAAELLPWCRENNLGVIAYSPMQSGILTGRFTHERAAVLPADDWRRDDPEFNQPRLDRNLELQAALEPIASHHGTSPAAVAVAWVLAWQGVSGAICGARRPDQIPDWLPALELRLDDRDLHELAEAIERTGAGTGPAMPQRD
jgi:aryl-alcohol dehydrogenase-like predicted oxidoreductase